MKTMGLLSRCVTSELGTVVKFSILQGRSNWGGQGGPGHPNILRKFEILSINPESFDHFVCLATPKFWSP